MALGSLLLPLILLAIGVSVGTLVLKNSGAAMAQQRLVAVPILGGAEHLRQGPWPECVGKSGDDCASLIQSNAPDANVQIVPWDSMVTMDFRTDRVRVWTNEAGVVDKIPSRG